MRCMSWFDFDNWEHDRLRQEWDNASPFPHLILDNALSGDALERLRQAVENEPHSPYRNTLYEMMASNVLVQHPTLSDFQAALEQPLCMDAMTTISGHSLSYVDLRSYVYLRGSFLLPHSDLGPSARRRIAYTLYLSNHDEFEGGELVLYDCTFRGDDLVKTKPAVTIEPLKGRLVLFEVSKRSMHEVMEVTLGTRISITGWFSQ